MPRHRPQCGRRLGARSHTCDRRHRHRHAEDHDDHQGRAQPGGAGTQKKRGASADRLTCIPATRVGESSERGLLRHPRRGPQWMVDRRKGTQHGDRLVGQVLAGHEDPDRPAVDDHVQCRPGMPVWRLSCSPHDLEPTDDSPGPHTFDARLLGVGERPTGGFDPEVECGETPARIAPSTFDHPNVRQFHATCNSRTVTAPSPSTVSDAKSRTRIMEIQPRPVIDTSRIVKCVLAEGPPIGGDAARRGVL